METSDSLDIFSGMIGAELSRSMHQLNKWEFCSKHRDYSPFPCQGTGNNNSVAFWNVIIRCEEADYFQRHITLCVGSFLQAKRRVSPGKQ